MKISKARILMACLTLTGPALAQVAGEETDFNKRTPAQVAGAKADFNKSDRNKSHTVVVINSDNKPLETDHLGNTMGPGIAGKVIVGGAAKIGQPLAVGAAEAAKSLAGSAATGTAKATGASVWHPGKRRKNMLDLVDEPVSFGGGGGTTGAK